MAGNVINCKKCQKIFQRRVGDICPDCIKVEEEQFVVLYRMLQKTASQGGIAIDELAKQANIPADEIEKMYMEGRLSTAGIYLKLPCQACSVLTREVERKGRYCLKCSEQTANQAGVEVKTLQSIRKEDEQERRRQEQVEMLKKAHPPAKEPRKFGFTSRQHY